MDPDAYARDWDLLACICRESTAIRRRFGPRSLATGKEIYEIWPDIVATRTAWPCLFRIFHEMLRDTRLAARIRHCCLRRLERWEWEAFEFKEVYTQAVLRLGWAVARSACKWIAGRGTHESWMPWSTDTLTEEVRRAIKDLRRDMGLQDGLPAEIQSDEDSGLAERDYQGRSVASPSHRLEAIEDICKSATVDDAEVFKKWAEICDNATEEEEDDLAKRHGLTDRVALYELLRRVACASSSSQTALYRN
jgi:hypothetical protein